MNQLPPSHFHISYLFIFLFLLSPLAQSNEDAVVLLKTIDELYRSDNSISTMKMSIVTPNWQRTLEMQTWTVGMDDTFIRILSPKKDRGVATLKIALLNR